MIQKLPKNIYVFIWHFIRPYKIAAFAFISLAALAGFWGPLNFTLMKHIIDTLPKLHIEGNISSITFPVFLVMLNFIVFDNFTWRGVDYIHYKYQALIKNQIIKEVLENSLGLSHQFFQDNLSGKIARNINNLADSLEYIIYDNLPNLVRGLALVLVSLATAYYTSPVFFYVMFIWFIAFACFSVAMSRRLVILSGNYASDVSTLSGQVVDVIVNNSNVRIFARKDDEMSRLDKFFTNVLDSFRKQNLAGIFLDIGQGGMIAVMIGFEAYFLIKLYAQDLITIGDFALMLGITMELGHLMWYTMTHVESFYEKWGELNQSFTSLITNPEIEPNLSAKDLVVTKGEVVFENVRFNYSNMESLFQNKSIVIKSGQKLGLVGYSGGGKSTFVNLILRLYEIEDGNILIDNQNIRDVTSDSLRNQIAMIAQDPSLFHRSIMENIRYGKLDATDEEVVEAAKKADAHEFISCLPEGYNSLVGERGVKLSGGQRQRISIARAILKNAPILILDEATSQLDSVTEAAIQTSLWELMQDKTTIIIAHRLSTLLHMDRILVFDKGKIVEDGNHSELLEKAGLYKALWDAQVGGFLGDS